MTAVAAEADKEAMSRPLVLACGLALVGAMSAGCGGNQAAVRQEAKQLLDDGNPKILRISTVRDLGDNRQIVATLQGHFKLPPACNNPRATRCRISPVSYVWLSFSQPKGMTGIQTTSASQIAAVDNARSANPLFSIFPDFMSFAIRCAIPRGNSSGTIAAACITFSKTGSSGPNGHVNSIEFRERWPFVPGREGDWHDEKVGGWIVSLDRHERVQSTRTFGDLAPQLWK